MEKITLDTVDVANLLGISRQTVYTMVRKKEVPHFKARGKILFNREIIEKWTRGEYQQEG